MVRFNSRTGAFLMGALIIACVAAVMPPPAPTSGADDNPAIRLGVFDSRAIAIARVNSAGYQAEISGLRAQIVKDIEAARAAGDTARVAELEAIGPAMQKRMHEQGFGSAPVHEHLATLKNALPGIAERAGVDAIVSKWELVYQAPDARFVDVTMLLVAEFDPDERTLGWIEDLAGSRPIPVEELTHEH
jgi:hypothetical protein